MPAIPYMAILKSKWLYIGLLALAVLFYRQQAHSWENAFKAQRGAYQAASAKAETAHIAAKMATEARYRTKARISDDRHQAALESASSAAERFIAAGGVRRACNQRAPGAAVATAASGSAASPDGASARLMSSSVVPDFPPSSSYAIVPEYSG